MSGSWFYQTSISHRITWWVLCVLGRRKNDPQNFFSSTTDYINSIGRFLDPVSFDGTCKTNNENLALYQILYLDMNSTAISVYLSFISRETSAVLLWFLSFFRRSTDSWVFVGTVTDDSLEIATTITEVHPISYHILCRLHLSRKTITRISHYLSEINLKFDL